MQKLYSYNCIIKAFSHLIIAESYEEVFNSSDNDCPIFTTSTSSDNDELNYQVVL